MDRFERDGYGMRANHAIAIGLGGAAGTNVVHFAFGKDAQTRREKPRARAHGAFEQGWIVNGAFDPAGGADFARLEDDGPSGDGCEKFFGESDHGSDC